MNSITEAGRETATERDKLSADSLLNTRARRSGNPPPVYNWAPPPTSSPKGIISARGRTHPRLPDEQQPAPPPSETLSHPPPAHGNHLDATLPRASSQNTARLANVKRTPRRSGPSATGLRLALDPRPCRTHLQILRGPDCPRHSNLSDIRAPEAAGHPGTRGGWAFAYGSATATWLQSRGLTSQLSMLKPPPH